MLRAYLIATVGLVICGAILGCVAVIGVDHLVSDDPIPDAQVGSLVFGGGALLVLVIAGRAALRAYRGATGRGPLTWLAYAAPVLVIAGFGGGLLFGVRVVTEHHAFSDGEARRACASGPGDPLQGPELERCLEVARSCNRAVREHPPEVGRGVVIETDPTLADLSIQAAAVVRCLREHGVQR